ncbi:amino acid ABC transporter ATP-binding protein [Sphingobium fluviale]|uniref:Amino acid ABC transporter ATP-binding protein n=1 Tax=Sphingobium fluviale TaxID=2506423 RepID=A0A4Q1KG78_9SPHN|nr:amino acid ABC transporter ATP-binding protein [Sphingobium fluviale]RXR25210.1 amino acid ABC transporter ATP-binding protein [Sphingobium fluviale]
MTEFAIRLVGLNKYYGQYHALRNVDLAISRGQRIVLCGPSGSGKSTLTRCMNLLERPESGKVEIEGVNILERSAAAAAALRRVGMVFQQFNLFPHKTILQNCVLAPLLVARQPTAIAEERALHFLDKVRIADQAHKYPSQLSGGQQQRAAIARALTMDPEILLFDEPTSALDPEMIKEVLDVMVALADEGRTMVCVTHEMGFARQVADRVLFMDEGSIVEDRDPQSFFEAPTTERARQFLSQLLKH